MDSNFFIIKRYDLLAIKKREIKYHKKLEKFVFYI